MEFYHVLQIVQMVSMTTMMGVKIFSQKVLNKIYIYLMFVGKSVVLWKSFSTGYSESEFC